MSLLWWRRRPEPEGEPVISEATRARIQAQRDLADDVALLGRLRDETPTHAALARRLRELRTDNHFAAGFEQIPRRT